MTVNVLEVRKARHSSCSAEVKVELSLDDHVVTIDDIRVIPNRRGEYWVALPSYSVSNGSRDYKYLPAVILSRGLMGELEETVLGEFQRWRKSQ